MAQPKATDAEAPKKPEWQIAEDAAKDPDWPPMAPAVPIRFTDPDRGFPMVPTAGTGADGSFTAAETKQWLTKAQYTAGLEAGIIERIEPPAKADIKSDTEHDTEHDIKGDSTPETDTEPDSTPKADTEHDMKPDTAAPPADQEAS